MNNYKEPHFVNRYEEIKIIKNDISANQGQKAFFLSSKAGIGKSRLCVEILKDIDNIHKVKLEIPGLKVNGIQDGYYIKKLAQTFDLNSKTLNIYSFEEYLRKEVQEKDLDNFLSNIVDGYLSKSSTYKNTKEMVDKFFSLGKFESDKIFDANLSETFNYCCSYIKQCVSSNYFVVNIENIQNIDFNSLNCLSDIIKSTKNIYLLLEYTLLEESKWDSIHDIEEQFVNTSTNLKVEIKELKPLSLNNLIEILKNDNDLFIKYISSSYNEWDGNLRRIVDIHHKIHYSHNVKEFINQSTNNINYLIENDLKALSTKEQHILLLVAVHPDPIDIKIINQIHNLNNFNLLSTVFDFELDLDKLVDKRLLRKINQKYIVSDDSILNYMIRTNDFTTIRIMVTNIWLQIYNILYKNGNQSFISQSELLYYILYFSIQSDEEQNILKYINEIFFLFHQNTPIWAQDWVNKILSSLEKTQNQQIKNMILIRLSEITQNLALSELSYEIINSIKSENNHILLSKAILLEDISIPKEALNILNNLTNDINLSTKLYIYSRVTQIACYRSLNKYAKGKEIFDDFEKNKDQYSQHMEYGFILRQAGSLYNTEEALPYVKESVNHFEKFSAYKQMVHSKIELSILYIRLEKYEEAKTELEEALNFNENNYDFIDRYIIINNLSTIKIRERENLQQTFVNLKQLLSDIQLPFDKLAVYINLLVTLCLLNMDKGTVLELCETIHGLCLKDKPSDKEIRRRAYFNIIIACIVYDEEELFHKYKNQFLNIKIETRNNDLDNQFQALTYTADKNIIVNDFMTNNLAHWHVEFDDILNNFQ